MVTKLLRRGQGGEGNSGSKSSSEKWVQFFKIISPAEDSTLRIPEEFVRKYGKKMPKVGSFEVPTGEVWDMELVHSQGHVCLTKGWKEFTQKFSIREGHFLVFKYDGKYHFHVIIFDRSATEIEYPQFESHGGGDEENARYNAACNSEYDDDDDDDDDEFFQEEMETECVQNKRKRKEGFGSKVVDVKGLNYRVKLEESLHHVHESSPYLKPKNKSVRAYREQSNTDKWRSDRKESNAIERAKSFRSKNPFYISVMHRSYVSYPYTLSIPLSFVKDLFTSRYNDLLLISSGRSWSAKCTVGTSPNVKMSGWKDFVLDNKLKMGDVCILEVLKGGSPLIFNVIIFRAD
ncbi:unnamed protein product [Cuscuta epithymum]|uniref:TF-B3 domain-containing protein n=1 Tax=Cuscuta epithymum TaxID=186058 RepID=A0AAV0DIL1_9ASTE|nr:unnamed protein product [Cuscuta epithymum]